MEFLKKHTKAHKYMCCLTPIEIRTVLEPHVPSLRTSIDVKMIRVYPELEDERVELNAHIIERARQDLQYAMKKKFPKNIDPTYFKHLCNEFHVCQKESR